MKRPLQKIFNPESVAVIGASNKRGSVGYAVMKNVGNAGYKGRVYPVNIKHHEIQGRKNYHRIKDIPEIVDLAIVLTPASTVPGLIEECGRIGIAGMIILSGGFKEVGPKGKRLFTKIKNLGRKYGIRIIGPNCLGIISPHIGLNSTFISRMALPGHIAFISQSGSLCASILDWSVDQSVGFSHFVSVGSMVDIGFHDLIDYLATDKRTSCILIYMETLTEARKFMSAARAFARSKPIIVLKAGISLEGAKAALSHTGSLAGNDAVFNAAFRRAGLIRVYTVAQLFNCAQALAMQPLPEGNRLAIVTNSGGPGILATDYLVNHGGVLARLSKNTIEALNKTLNPAWSRNNPVDILGDASLEHYKQAVKYCLEDSNIDGLLISYTAQAMIPDDKVTEEIANIAKDASKPVFGAWMGETDVAEGREVLERAGIPVYRYPESAVDVFLRMYRYGKNLEMLYETPLAIPSELKGHKDKARKIILKAWEEGRDQLSDLESKQLLTFYDLPTNEIAFAETKEQAVKNAVQIGYPVALKIASPDIAHKTEVGGVRLQLLNSKELADACLSMEQSVRNKMPEARIDGFFIEKMHNKRYELLLGAKKDPIFGPVIVFGAGGINVEIYKDRVIGLPPLNMALAERMIERTKVYELLKGFRGLPPVNLKRLCLIMVKFANLITDLPEISEFDINPLAIDESGAIALDAHIVLDQRLKGRDEEANRELVISPYPNQYQKIIETPEGVQVKLRPIKPEDEPLEAELYEYLSKETLYFRFFGFVPKPNHEMLTRFTHIDYDREMAIVAEIDDGGKKRLIGVVRIVADSWGESAEYAIVLADQWHRKGLGTKMTHYIFEIARDLGYKKLYASILESNESMFALVEKLGFKIHPLDDKTCYAEYAL
jgi:acetyltransferase